jgi:hypothetical protein
MGNSWHGNERLVTCAATIGCTSHGDVFPIRCKRWDCPTCAAINARIHAVKVANGIYALISAGVIPQFVTLTLPGNIGRTRAFERLVDMWEKMSNRWRYAARTVGKVKLDGLTIDGDGMVEFEQSGGTPLIFAAFVELQGRGVPHFHIISTFAPKERIVKDMAVASGMGYQVKVERVKRGAGVAWYISKYAGKTQGKMGLPKGFRRVRYSESWPGMRLKLDEVNEETDKIVKRWDEGTESFITRARAIYNVDIRAEVYAIADSVPDDRVKVFVEG